MRNLRNQETFTVGQGSKKSGSQSFHFSVLRPTKVTWTSKVALPLNNTSVSPDFCFTASFIKTISSTSVKKKAILINIVTLKLDFLTAYKIKIASELLCDY